MENQDILNEFLVTFRSLEEKLTLLSKVRGEYVSFSRALEECRYKKIVPILQYDKVYKVLKNASDLRNMLSHQNDICYPTYDFYTKFKMIANEIIDPLTIYDICIKKSDIVYATLSSNVLEVIDLMVENHLSHVPVMQKNQVVGVFSTNTFFQYVYNNKNIKVNEEYQIKDYILKDEYHMLNDDYLFVSRNEKASSILKYLFKKNPNQKRTSVFFITENGKKDESLLGLATPIDILKVPQYKDLY